MHEFIVQGTLSIRTAQDAVSTVHKNAIYKITLRIIIEVGLHNMSFTFYTNMFVNVTMSM